MSDTRSGQRPSHATEDPCHGQMDRHGSSRHVCSRHFVRANTDRVEPLLITPLLITPLSDHFCPLINDQVACSTKQGRHTKMAALPQPSPNTFTATSWCALTGQVIRLDTSRKLRHHHGVDRDNVTEFILYYLFPARAPYRESGPFYGSMRTISWTWRRERRRERCRCRPKWLAWKLARDQLLTTLASNSLSQQDLINRDCEIDEEAMHGIEDFSVAIKGGQFLIGN
jgi:hypothetical protein